MKKSITINALKKLPQWVTYRNEFDQNGRPTKVPYQPLADSLTKASTTDPATWGTYEDAEADVLFGDFYGVGIVFRKGGGIVGIDLDGCRNPETGKIEPWAQEIIDRANSYTEISPSGTGIHILVQGSLPTEQTGWKRYLKHPAIIADKRPGVEIYQRGRFFTFTGKEVLTQTRQSQKFCRLFDGDISEYGR